MSKRSRVKWAFLRPNVIVLMALIYLEVMLLAGAVTSLFSFDNGYPAIGFFLPLAIIGVYLLLVLGAYFKERLKGTKSKGVSPRAYRVTTIGTLVSLAFAVFNLVMSLLTSSPWYGAMATYYMTLLLARLQALYSGYKAEEKYADDKERMDYEKEKIAFRSGILSLILSMVISSILGTILIVGRPGISGVYYALAVACYTFYKLGRTIHMAALQKKKGKDPIVGALISINFCDAVFSMVTLAVMLESTFGDGTDMSALNFIVGGLAVIASLSAGIYTIYTHGKALKKAKAKI